MDMSQNNSPAGIQFHEDNKPRGAFVETAFTFDQVMAAIVEDAHLRADDFGCAFLGLPEAEQQALLPQARSACIDTEIESQ